MLEGGIGFVSELGGADEDLADEALQLLVGWLTGDRLTDRRTRRNAGGSPRADPPFADAWRWGAFYVAGRPTLELAG